MLSKRSESPNRHKPLRHDMILYEPDPNFLICRRVRFKIVARRQTGPASELIEPPALANKFFGACLSQNNQGSAFAGLPRSRQCEARYQPPFGESAQVSPRFV